MVVASLRRRLSFKASSHCADYPPDGKRPTSIPMPVRPIELGLARTDGTTADAELVRLADQLLELVAGRAVESETLGTPDFRRRLEQYRQELSSIAGAEAFADLAARISDTCRAFFKRGEAFEREREREIGELIETMTQAVAKLAGEAVTVNAELSRQSERFGRLTEVEDIRELKRRVSQEVSALDRFVAEKRSHDEAYYSKLTRQIDHLQSRLRETEEAAALDPLTQVPNRGTFDRTLARWLGQGAPFALALLDIDDFKRVNDTYGHPVGDRVLLAAARKLSSQVRAGDLVARYGGEEFAVLLAGTTLKQAEARMNEVIRGIAASVYDFEVEGAARQLRYTMSCGVSDPARGDAAEAVVSRADEALYDAKRRGKNCVVSRKAPLLARVFQ
jgi:diguanylate cyclase